MATNNFSNKVSILAELWMNYRDDDQLKDFVEYNDLGLPLAYFIHNELVEPREQAATYVDETYLLLLGALGLDDDEFDNLDDMLLASPPDEG